MSLESNSTNLAVSPCEDMIRRATDDHAGLKANEASPTQQYQGCRIDSTPITWIRRRFVEGHILIRVENKETPRFIDNAENWDIDVSYDLENWFHAIGLVVLMACHAKPSG